MAITLEQVRQQYPQYNDKSDEELATALHKKFYSSMPQDEFFNKIGFSKEPVQQQEQISMQQEQLPPAYVRYPLSILQGMATVGQNIGEFPFKLMGMKSSEPVDFRKALGYQYQPTGGERLAETITEQVPGLILPEAKLFGAVSKLKQLPKVGSYLASVAGKGLPFAAYKSTQEETPMKGFEKGLAEYALGEGALRGAGAAAKSIKSALRPVDVEKTYGGIQKAYEEANSKLGNLFEFVTKQAKDRGIENVGKIDETFIDDAKNLLPASKTNKKLISNAGEGNYESIRKLYSKIGQYRRNAKDFETAELYDDLRDRINDSLKNHFISTGNKDLSQWLDAAKSGYSQLKQTYESTPMLRKLVGESQEIPETLKPLMKKNTEMARIRELHPEIEKDIAAQNTRKNLKRLGIGAAMYEGYKKLTRD